MATTLKLTAVDSSMILAAGYDGPKRELEVLFRAGGIWRYRNVPRKVFNELMASGSKGAYMHDFIIDRYPYYRMRHR